MSVDRSHVAELYHEYAGVMCSLMRHRFGVPEFEIENLLHDIFASLLCNPTPIENFEKWLVGAACNASRQYWRDRGNGLSMVVERKEQEHIERSILLDQILEQLPVRSAEILRLRYLEGLSGREIARRYGFSFEYTHLRIHRALRKARIIARDR
jgi:RNA polymerase sigma factor (sigma-70 family)